MSDEEKSAEEVHNEIAELMGSGIEDTLDESEEDENSEGEEDVEDASADDSKEEESEEGDEEEGEDDEGVEEDEKESSEIAALREQVLALTQKLSDIPEQKQEEEKEEEDPEIPSYLFSVNPKLVELLVSEDSSDRAQAVQSLVSSIGKAVHTQVRAEFNEKLNKAKTDITTNVVDQTDKSIQQRNVESDFYGTYDKLNTTAGRMIVQTVTRRLQGEGKITGYNAAAKLAIATEAQKELEKLTGAKFDLGDGGNKKKAGKKKKRPAKLTKQGARGGRVEKLSREDEDMLNILSD